MTFLLMLQAFFLTLLTVPRALDAYPAAVMPSAAVYGTKRFGGGAINHGVGSSIYHSASALPAEWHQQPLYRAQRHPNYYELYQQQQQQLQQQQQQHQHRYDAVVPHAYYYPPPQQDPYYYNSYYPRTSKYEVYQAVMPYYYYPDRHYEYSNANTNSPPHGYYYSGGAMADSEDPMFDLETEMLQQDEAREQRERAQPIGHETYYETDDAEAGGSDQPQYRSVGSSDEDDDDVDQESMDQVNAAFLQNLIMSQMYGDGKFPMDDEDGGDLDAEYYDAEAADEDVRELKELARPHQNAFRSKQQQPMTAPSSYKTPVTAKHRMSNSWDDKRSPPPPSTVKRASQLGAATTTVSPVTTARRPVTTTRGGQKEEVLLRPATPVRRPFSQPVMDMLHHNRQQGTASAAAAMGATIERKRAPSVYDTIKHMLEMEEKLDKENSAYKSSDLKSAMRKRIVAPEADSLTKQLKVLKNNKQ